MLNKPNTVQFNKSLKVKVCFLNKSFFAFKTAVKVGESGSGANYC